MGSPASRQARRAKSQKLMHNTESTALFKGEVNKAAIEKILSAPPVGESGRHADGIKRLRHLRSNGMGREGAVQAILQLYPHGSGTDRKINQKDFYRAYDEADKLPLEPWATSARNRSQSSRIEVNGDKVTFTTYQHDGSREELPAEERKLTFSAFLKDVLGFKDDEYVWFATKEEIHGGERDGELRFTQFKSGNLVKNLTEEGDATFALDDLSGEGLSAHGSYFAVNPFKSGESRKPDNISRFLYTLVEHDKISREEQLAFFKRSGLPIKALIDTGGKSIHAIVLVDATSPEE